MFFFRFFWAFFDSSLSSSIDIGIVWPPLGVAPISAYSVPLLNTVILLSSGVTVTWSHHSLVNNSYFPSFFRLFITILLGFFFLYTQYLEYAESSFSIRDGVYGSTFFIRTGFHGVHVIVGTLMLTYTLSLLLKGGITHNHHFTFEAAA
jgi:cytochrome c oxidase subunit 3